MHMSDRGHRGCVKKYNHKADELKLGNRQSPVGCRNSIIFLFYNWTKITTFAGRV